MHFIEYILLGKNIKECDAEMITILPGFTIKENSLFDDCSHVKIYAAESKIAEWNYTTCKTRDRSLHILREQIAYHSIQLLILCQDQMLVEHTLSLLNSLWTV